MYEWSEILPICSIKAIFEMIVPSDVPQILITGEGVSFVKFFRGKVMFESEILNRSLRVERRKIVSHDLRWNIKL